MSEERRKKREFDRHMNVLSDHLGDFYEFLSRVEKPTNEEVRERFIKTQKHWKDYCYKKKLPVQMQMEFNRQVSMAWKRKQTT